MGADRRAEVPVFDPAELSAQREDVLLHASARTERQAVVAARRHRGPLQLPLFRQRAAGVRGHRRCGESDCAEIVPLHEQSLRGQVGGERGDAEGAAWRGDRRQIPARADRALSRYRRSRDYFALCFTVARLMTSGMRSFWTTSIPEITCPHTV